MPLAWFGLILLIWPQPFLPNLLFLSSFMTSLGTKLSFLLFLSSVIWLRQRRKERCFGSNERESEDFNLIREAWWDQLKLMDTGLDRITSFCPFWFFSLVSSWALFIYLTHQPCYIIFIPFGLLNLNYGLQHNINN